MALTLLPELTEKMTSTVVSVVTVNDLFFPQILPPLSNMIAAAMQNIFNKQFDFVYFFSFITTFL